MLRFWRERPAPSRPTGEWDLDEPLLQWSGSVNRRPADHWTIRDSLDGTLICGATGSGKSSGSGRTIARSFLQTGYGGLVLTAKADERSHWETYCRETGRSDDLIVFGPEQPWKFNFLDYEVRRPGSGAGLTENIVNLFSTVLEVAERSSSGGGRDDEGYWKRAARQLGRNLIDLAILADGRITVPELYAMLISAPNSLGHLTSKTWQKASLLYQALKRAERRVRGEREKRSLGLVADYFLGEWPALSEKTRSVILSSFTSMLDVLNRGIACDLFSGETNLTPEATWAGKIVLIDLPVKEFSEVGEFAQVLWKHAFQRSVERRSVHADPRPVFLWADEAQYFVTSYDMQFQTTCRGARVATVLLTQNVSNFYAALGNGDRGRAEADSLFANLNTKCFHANGDPVTNEWASSLIGRTRQFMMNGSNSRQDAMISSILNWGDPAQTSAGFSEQMDYEVEPSEFTRLRTGGPANGLLVDGILVRNGRVFASNRRTWLPLTFSQK